MQRRDGTMRIFEVVAADPNVEVELPALSPEQRVDVRPRYLRPHSRSAQIAALLEEERALVFACGAKPVGKCGGVRLMPDPARSVAGHAPRAAIERLSATLTTADPRYATWAYFNAGCPESAFDAEIAAAALQEPADTLARNVWPVGIARAILAAEGPAGAEVRLAAMVDRADRDLAAAILVEMVNDARHRQHLARAAALYASLREGDGAWQGSPLANTLLAVPGVLGAPVGSIPMRTLTGELRDPAAMTGAPVLIYTAASWCHACHADALSELRDFAAKHPDLQVLYVLWDPREAAQAFVNEHSPVPGTIVLADDVAKAKLEVVLGAPAFPSFVLIDSNGRVVAIPGDDGLESTVEISGVLAP